jgi:hypothetical protein
MGGKANSQEEPLSTRELVALQNSVGANGLRPRPLSGDELLTLGDYQSSEPPSLKAPDPSLRDRYRWFLTDAAKGLGMDKHLAYGTATKIGALTELASPFGVATAAEDSARAFGAGDYFEAGLAALGAIPAFKPAKAIRSLPVKTHLPMDEASRMARAKDAGFRTGMPLYHGTARDFPAFDPRKLGSSTGSATAREAFWLSRDPDLAGYFAKLAAKSGRGSAIMPLLHRAKNPARITLKGSEDELQIAATLSVAFENGYDAVLFNNYRTPMGKKQILAVKDPTLLRSRFAAFDPKKIKSRNLLASLATVGGISVVLDGDEGKP